MKAKYYIAGIAAALLAAGCQLTEDPVFSEKSSERMNAYLEDVRAILQSAQYGWSMEYYPAAKYAGTTYALKFTSGEVTAIHESDINKSVKSTYILTTDDGPVLSFDTYNEVLHKYATPSASKYQAMGGDFEFAILSYGQQEIKLRGRRSRNICTLRPLKKDGAMYLDDINYMSGKIALAAVKCNVDGIDYVGYLDSGTRTLSYGPSYSEESDLEGVRYVVTDKGIHFARTVSIGSADFTDWTYVKKDTCFVSGDYNFEKMIPKGWVSYNDYLGNYTLYYDNGEGSFSVQLVQDVKGATFKMKGLYKTKDVEIGYNGGRGRLTWVRQTVGTSGQTEYVLCPYDSGGGYFTWGEDIGLYGYVTDTSGVPSSFTVDFADNGVWEDYYADSWLSYAFTGEARDPATGAYTFANGNYYLLGKITLVKK